MAETVHLSEPALTLIRLRLSGQRVEVAPENRDAYRELAEAGLAEPVHTPRGRDSHYRLTLAAMDMPKGQASFWAGNAVTGS